MLNFYLKLHQNAFSGRVPEDRAEAVEQTDLNKTILRSHLSRYFHNSTVIC